MRFPLIATIGIILAGMAVPGNVAAQPSSRVRVGAGAAPIRVGPSPSGDVIIIANPGTILDVIEGGDDQWYWVWLPTDVTGARRRGWIQAQDVQPVNAANMGRTSTPSATAQDTDAQQRLEKARRDLEESRQEYEAALQRAQQPGGRAVAPENANSAADPRRRSAAPRSHDSVGIRAFGAVDSDTFKARNTFDALLGTSRLMAFGGGADVLNIWKSAFVRVAVSRISKSGNRAFVANGQVVSLGIPITVSMTPVEVGGGWRFGSSRAAPVVPYAGGGLVVQPYSERSSFAGPNDDASGTTKGYTAFGGVEIGLGKWLIVGGEAQFRSIPNALGSGSVSQDFGETNLGGFALRVLFGVRR